MPEKLEVRNGLAAALAAALVVGCAGYAADYAVPKAAIVTPELTRFGFDEAKAECVADALGASLSVWQLRQLAMIAETVTQGYADRAKLTPGDLLYVSTYVKDPKVAPELARVAESCAVDAVASAPAPGAAPVPGTPAAAATGGPVTWINLGQAPTGQAIAVDASSIAEEAPYRRAWFRLTNPGGGRGSAAYLLRIDCAARTINQMGLRKYASDGAIAEQRDYGPAGEGTLQVEGGTVMEIAYLALCT